MQLCWSVQLELDGLDNVTRRRSDEESPTAFNCTRCGGAVFHERGLSKVHGDMGWDALVGCVCQDCGAPFELSLRTNELRPTPIRATLAGAEVLALCENDPVLAPRWIGHARGLRGFREDVADGTWRAHKYKTESATADPPNLAHWFSRDLFLTVLAEAGEAEAV
jgi:hypothetical protein